MIALLLRREAGLALYLIGDPEVFQCRHATEAIGELSSSKRALALVHQTACLDRVSLESP